MEGRENLVFRGIAKSQKTKRLRGLERVVYRNRAELGELNACLMVVHVSGFLAPS